MLNVGSNKLHVTTPVARTTDMEICGFQAQAHRMQKKVQKATIGIDVQY